MNISITPELEAFVTAKVESGLYNNASEVMRAALRVLKEHDDWTRYIHEQIERAELADGPTTIAEMKAGLETIAKTPA